MSARMCPLIYNNSQTVSLVTWTQHGKSLTSQEAREGAILGPGEEQRIAYLEVVGSNLILILNTVLSK